MKFKKTRDSRFRAMWKFPVRTAFFLTVAGLCFAGPFWDELYQGPSNDDPSRWNPLSVHNDPQDGPAHMNDGAYEGGLTGTHSDTQLNNSVPNPGEGGGSGGFDLPTGGPPSPLYGVQSFTQPMLRFEEFGPEPMPKSYAPGSMQLPPPLSPEGTLDPAGTPDGKELDEFLAQEMWPKPTWMANEYGENPWKKLIEEYLGWDEDYAFTPPCEGRPGGEGWAHQRWDEFYPVEYFKTAQCGARVNGGLRDGLQLHKFLHRDENNEHSKTADPGDLGYSEFGPGGLYHNGGTSAGTEVRFHPDMPIQDPKTLWTWDGTMPPKLLSQRLGRTVLMRHYNALPIDVSANRGFGLHTITTHEHNGHNPSESDGYFDAFFYPGQFYDYHWPMVVAGTDTINTSVNPTVDTPSGTLPACGYPDGNGGIVHIPGDPREVMSTHWFHDHMLDFTAQNVYKGNAAMMNYYSSLDRGNEAIEDGVNLRFPSGSSVDWGNRDYDVNLMLACKAWDQVGGQLWYNPFQTNGMLGDQILTNWVHHPVLDVRARRYRFRLLNASVARYLTYAYVVERQGSNGEFAGPPGSGISYDRVPVHMICNDGNIMEHSLPFDGSLDLDDDGDFTDHHGILPTQGVAERYDIIIDFSRFDPGDHVYMVNVLEHKNGKGPNREVPLSEILSERYKAVAVDNDGDGLPDSWKGGDPTVSPFLRFDVKALEAGQVDRSMNPEDYEPGGLVMQYQPTFSPEELENARTRTYIFGRSGGSDGLPWTVKNVDGAHMADPRRLTTAPAQGDVEIWTIKGKGGWSHPVHIHFEEGKVLSRGGKPPPLWEKYGRKDVYRIGRMADSSLEVVLAMRFREFAGSYMEHCHNTTHEDNAMLVRWDIEHPGQVKLMPTPQPTWNGVGYVDSFALHHFRVGDDELVEPPVAMNDAFTCAPGRSESYSLLDNDECISKGVWDRGERGLDPGSVKILTLPAEGSCAVDEHGIVTYTAPASVGMGTTITMEYIMQDANGTMSNTGKISVFITGTPASEAPESGEIEVEETEVEEIEVEEIEVEETEVEEIEVEEIEVEETEVEETAVEIDDTGGPLGSASPGMIPESLQMPGDCNQDGELDLSDVICLLGHLFQGTPENLPCSTDAANLGLMDCNQDGGIDLSDAIYKLAFLFQGGPGLVAGSTCISIGNCPENSDCGP